MIGVESDIQELPWKAFLVSCGLPMILCSSVGNPVRSPLIQDPSSTYDSQKFTTENLYFIQTTKGMMRIFLSLRGPISSTRSPERLLRFFSFLPLSPGNWLSNDCELKCVSFARLSTWENLFHTWSRDGMKGNVYWQKETHGWVSMKEDIFYRRRGN